MRAPGCPDFLINNAGYTLPGWLEKLSADDFQSGHGNQFFWNLHTTQALSPLLAQRRGPRCQCFFHGRPARCVWLYGILRFEICRRRLLRGASTGSRPLRSARFRPLPPDTLTPGLEKENKIKPPEVLKAERNGQSGGTRDRRSRAPEPAPQEPVRHHSHLGFKTDLAG